MTGAARGLTRKEERQRRKGRTGKKEGEKEKDGVEMRDLCCRPKLMQKKSKFHCAIFAKFTLRYLLSEDFFELLVEPFIAFCLADDVAILADEELCRDLVDIVEV